jgi:CheY-like chemotaxis protein
MDIAMPIMDGYEATKHIRKLEKLHGLTKIGRSYIIGLTAHSTNIYKQLTFEAGMDDFSKY